MIDPNQPPLYRYVTTNNIRAGDVILEEEVWTWSFRHLGGAKSVCNYCFKAPDKLLSCSACKSAFYCDATCQRNDWRLRHKHDECKKLKTIRQMARATPGAAMKNFEEINFNKAVPHLLLGTASAQLYDAKGKRDEEGNPTTLLWKTFMQTPYKADLVDLPRNPKKLDTAVCRLVSHKDTADLIIQNRLLPSLVPLWNYEPWRKILQQHGIQYPKQVLITSRPLVLALGACLEMSKYPHTCERPNAITINDGRNVRMVALENIENLDQVRLTRIPIWLRESRCARNFSLYDVFGHGCFCSRCNAGDMAAETTLFGLRCPLWAKHYPKTDNEQACKGIVKGLRRSDYSDIGINRLTGQPDADLDEPRPLPSCIALAPPHERAICQQCNAKYDAETMRVRILPLLKVFETVGLEQHRYDAGFPGESVRDEWVSKVMQAEQYVYPTNGVYLQAKFVLLTYFMGRILLGRPLLHGAAQWLKAYAREVLARVEVVGCREIDFRGLQEIVMVFGHYTDLVGINRQRMMQLDAETRELMMKATERATDKVKLLLRMGRT